jgi:hypothetical protein
MPYEAHRLAQRKCFSMLHYYAIPLSFMANTACAIDSSRGVSVLVRSFKSLFHALTSVIDMLKQTSDKWISLYDSYVKSKSYKLCRRIFKHRYLGVCVPASSTIFKLVKSMFNWVFLRQ